MVIGLAVFGLLLYLGLVAPYFRLANSLAHQVSLRAALPFAAVLPGYRGCGLGLLQPVAGRVPAAAVGDAGWWV